MIRYKANPTTCSSDSEIVNTIEDNSRPEFTLMPVHSGWTVVKQCLANPYEFGDLEEWLTEKGLDAADVVWMLWVAMCNSAKVDWSMYLHCNRAVVDLKGAKCIH